MSSTSSTVRKVVVIRTTNGKTEKLEGDEALKEAEGMLDAMEESLEEFGESLGKTFERMGKTFDSVFKEKTMRTVRRPDKPTKPGTN
jgi:hypothetical protein